MFLSVSCLVHDIESYQFRLFLLVRVIPHPIAPDESKNSRRMSFTFSRATEVQRMQFGKIQDVHVEITNRRCDNSSLFYFKYAEVKHEEKYEINVYDDPTNTTMVCFHVVHLHHEIKQHFE